MAHIALAAYDLETGGISRVVVYLANGFAACGHRVSVVLCTDAGELDSELRGMLSRDVAVVALANRRFRKRALGQVMTFAAMRRWLRAERPDVLLGTANNISWFSGLAVRGAGKARPRLFIKTTNPILRKADGPLITGIRRAGYGALFGSADAVLTLSDAETHLLEAQFAGSDACFRSVHNPYVTGRMVAAAPDGGDAGDAPLIVALGRLAPQKNFARAIRTLALVRKDYPESVAAHARLVILGEGPQRGELEVLANELGLADAVDMPGFVTDPVDMLARADLLLMSSEYEGLPASVIEALACGCPVVTTDCFLPARELLEGLPGCRVTGLTEAALAQGVVDSLGDPREPAILRARAADYSVGNAVASHLGVMGLA
ncbi:MAG: glycosyltransferase [Sphingomonadales bacterium]|nr:glycosyltransferase [Sphingomonadales bacterium]MBD3772268.1 glycosyltransferase [Paracoccaceae bacterium]